MFFYTYVGLQRLKQSFGSGPNTKIESKFTRDVPVIYCSILTDLKFERKNIRISLSDFFLLKK